MGKHIYLLVGLIGLAGATVIAIKVVTLKDISEIGMIIVFLLAVFCMGIMMIGFYGAIRKDGDK